jgi:hypothetical protein
MKQNAIPIKLFSWSEIKTDVVLENSHTRIECRCGYLGYAEKIRTGFFKTGEIERCPQCRRPIQHAVKCKANAPLSPKATSPQISSLRSEYLGGENKGGE